jgi:hypothetical protein
MLPFIYVALVATVEEEEELYTQVYWVLGIMKVPLTVKLPPPVSNELRGASDVNTTT